MDQGVRLIDTAASYKNESEVGAVLREEISLRGAAGIPREHVFLTSKLRPQDHGHAGTLRACQATLSRLGVHYLVSERSQAMYSICSDCLLDSLYTIWTVCI